MIKQDFIKIFFYITFTIKLLFSSPCFSSFEDLSVGARFQAMGGTSTASVNSADAIFLNCSGLGQINSFQFSFYYSNPFGIKELIHGSLSGTIPFSWGTIGLASKTFGNKLYQENEFLISFAKSIHQRFYFGFSMRYMRLKISNYGSDSSLGIDIGFITKINSQFKWGFFSHNLNRPYISSKKEAIPQIFSTGFNVNPVENISVNFDIYKDVKYPIELRFGFEYLILRQLAIRSGFITEPAQFTAGFGFLFSIMNIDYAFKTHSDLGSSHQFSLNIALQRKTFPKKEILKIEKSIISEKININTATSEQLQQLKGVGPTIADRIIQYREQWGPFLNIEEIKKVKGIGKELFEKIRLYITIE